MLGEFKVFRVKVQVEDKLEDRYEVFWCPSAPLHYEDKIPANNGQVYTKKQSAYASKDRLKKKLEQLNKEDKKSGEPEAVAC